MGNEKADNEDNRPDASMAAEFHLEELKVIRAKLEEHIKDIRKMELYSLAGFFGLLAWLASQRPIPSAPVWLLPVLIPVMLFLRNQGHQTRISVLGQYIRKLEIYFRSSSELGFEHHLDDSDKATAFKVYNLAFYSFMFVIALFALLMLRPQLEQAETGAAPWQSAGDLSCRCSAALLPPPDSSGQPSQPALPRTER